MKRIYTFTVLLASALLFIMADTLPTRFTIWKGGRGTEYAIDREEIVFGGNTLTVKGTTYALDDIDSITFDRSAPMETDTIRVTYDGATATVSALPIGVTATVEAANVELTSLVADRELCVVLSGESPCGQFVYNGSYKMTVLLEGLTLTGSTGAAIDIRCGKRIALKLAEGSVNTLADAQTDGGQKAALYTKGHLEVSGDGTLNLTGNVKHALSTKEYMLIKKSAGSINVLRAANDGIHAGQYFRMNGGTLTLTDIAGDGIQAEVTDDTTDEDNGQLMIAGGSLHITLTGSDVAALKSDSLLTVASGNVVIRTAGESVKGMKSKTDIVVAGGNISVTQSGTCLITDGDASYTAALKADGNVWVTGGTLTIASTAEAGKGISADGWVNVSETTGTTLIDIRNEGAGVNTGDGYTAKGISSDGGVKIESGTVGITMTGAGGKGIKTDGEFIMGTESGSGPTLNITTTGSRLGNSSGGGNFAPHWPTHEQLISARLIVARRGPGGRPGGGGPGGWGETSGGSSAKAIKATGAATLLGGELTVKTTADGAEGLESKTAVNILNGRHYLECYDDCINSSGNITFDGGITVCYANGNDAVDSNAGKAGAITIGNGVVLAYTTKGSPEEGLDCDNNSYIRITGTGIAISAGGAQGGSSSSTISNAAQGYAFYTGSVSYQPGRYYTIADASGNNLVTYSFPASFSSTLSLFTATGMVKGSAYSVKYSTIEPTDATEVFHGLYLGSTHQGTTSVCSFTAK